MALSEEEVRQLATLARIRIDDADISAVRENLGRIIDFVEQLEAARTEGVEPMAHPLDTSQRLRADEVTETDRRDRYLEEAPASKDGLFLVPRVIE